MEQEYDYNDDEPNVYDDELEEHLSGEHKSEKTGVTIYGIDKNLPIDKFLAALKAKNEYSTTKAVGIRTLLGQTFYLLGAADNYVDAMVKADGQFMQEFTNVIFKYVEQDPDGSPDWKHPKFGASSSVGINKTFRTELIAKFGSYDWMMIDPKTGEVAGPIAIKVKIKPSYGATIAMDIISFAVLVEE